MDAFIKQHRKLNIDMNIISFDKMGKELAKFEAAVNRVIAAREKLENSTNNNPTKNQEEALKRLEQREQKLFAERERLLADYAKLNEKVINQQFNLIEELAKKENARIVQTEDNIIRQHELFKRKFGDLIDIKLPVGGDLQTMTEAIKSIDGFSSANARAIGSAEYGNNVFQIDRT